MRLWGSELQLPDKDKTGQGPEDPAGSLVGFHPLYISRVKTKHIPSELHLKVIS